MPASKLLVEQGDLEVVAHSAVDRDERVLPALHGHHRVDRAGRRRHHAAARLDDDLGLRRQVRRHAWTRVSRYDATDGGSSDHV